MRAGAAVSSLHGAPTCIQSCLCTRCLDGGHGSGHLRPQASDELYELTTISQRSQK